MASPPPDRLSIPPATLLDLPDELVQMVAAACPPTVLFALAATCRRVRAAAAASMGRATTATIVDGLVYLHRPRPPPGAVAPAPPAVASRGAAAAATAEVATADAMWGGDGLLWPAASAEAVEAWVPGMGTAASQWAGRLARLPCPAAVAASLRGQLARLGVGGVRLGKGGVGWAALCLLGGTPPLPLRRVALHGEAFAALVLSHSAGDSPLTPLEPPGGEGSCAAAPTAAATAAAAAAAAPSLPPTLVQLSLDVRPPYLWPGGVTLGLEPLSLPWVSAVALPPLPALRVLAVAAGGLDARALAPIGIHFPRLVSLSLTGSVRGGDGGAFGPLALPALPALAHLHLGLCHCPPAAGVVALYAHRRLVSLDPAYDTEDLDAVVADVATVAALPAALTLSATDVDAGGAVLALRHHPHPGTLVALRLSLNGWGEVGPLVATLDAAFPGLTSLGIDLYGDGVEGGVTVWPPSRLTRLSLWVHDDGVAADEPVAAVTACAVAAATLTHLAVEADAALAPATVQALRRLRRLRVLTLRMRFDPASRAAHRRAHEREVRAAAPAAAVSVLWEGGKAMAVMAA